MAKLRLMARGANTTWTEELPAILLGLRTALRQDNNLSSALMTYGTTLRIPSDFFEPQKSTIDDAELVRRLARTMTTLTPVPHRSQSADKPFVHKDLLTCTHVFIRNDVTRPPLTPPYDGPYEVPTGTL